MAAKKKRVVKNVNWYVDTHYKLKQKRDALEEKVKEVKAEIEAIEEEALRKFGKEGIEGARGRIATGYIQELDHYNVENRAKLDAYVKRNGLLHLFQNRVSKAAVEELMHDKPRFKLATAGLGQYTSVHFRTQKR